MAHRPYSCINARLRFNADEANLPKGILNIAIGPGTQAGQARTVQLVFDDCLDYLLLSKEDCAHI
jgi:hypothetical protein